MEKKYEEFFLGLNDPNFLAMKLLLAVFKKFEKDPYSSRIIDNLSVLSQYDIRLINSEEAFCYIDLYGNSNRIDFAINSSGSESLVCHEFAHLLINMFAKGEIPNEFLEINRKNKKKLLNRRMFLSNLLGKYRDYAYDKLTEDIDFVADFYERHPSLKEEYFERFPDGEEDDMIEESEEEEE